MPDAPKLEVAPETVQGATRYRLYCIHKGERSEIDTRIRNRHTEAAGIRVVDPGDLVLTDNGLFHREVTVSLLRPTGLVNGLLGRSGRLYVRLKSLEIDGTPRLPEKHFYESRDGKTWRWISKPPTRSFTTLHKVELEILETR